jgi:ATP-dependent DNA helicase RecQ
VQKEGGAVPIIKRARVHKRANALLKSAYGENAEFREGQYEAIESIFLRKKTLVVQKTGWGKSLVYFIASKVNRERYAGVTFVISPLLVVMQNQIDAAKKMGLRGDVLNCETKNRRREILNGIKKEQYDIIFITPETLFSKDVERSFNKNEIRMGLFVIDEIHCISDWGHDFRLEYGKLNKVIKKLPPSVPILGTTATANNRVLADIERQLGKGVHVFRGSMFRESLAIQIMKMPEKAERYAWILKNIDKLPGGGIIYCITIMDCEQLATFLVEHGIRATSYHSAKSRSANDTAEKRFRSNDIKVLVATIKLGMGYDKDDIGFIIHFQAAPNIVSYYQQIGRAGRGLAEARIFLMAGCEDTNIHDYFIDTAFPYEYEAKNVLNVIKENSGCSINAIKAKINIRDSRVDKAIDFLIYEGFVFFKSKKYFRSKKKFAYKRNHYEEIKRIRKKEREEMRGLVETEECYSKFIINCLDDMSDIKCGKCTNCLGRDIVDRRLRPDEKDFVSLYINSKILFIKPKTYWAKTKLTEIEKMKYPNKPGICLAKWGDAGYGEMIKNCKKGKIAYPEALLERAFEVLGEIVKIRNVKLITFVPSKKNDLLEIFAKELAAKLDIKCQKLLVKVEETRQKGMQNSSHQCYNALKSYNAVANIPQETVILIDDLVDSGWTLAVCGHKLRENGAKVVIPFVLADSSLRDTD